MDSDIGFRARLFQGVADIAKLGWQEFPCKPEKTPYTKKGFKDATSDPDQLQKWWKRHPDALIGVRTGPESGIFVLDIDVDAEKGIDGTTWLAKMETEHGKLPFGPRARTPRGGLHLYFCYPSDRVVRCSAGKLAPGVDVRGVGGYAIVPPSRSSIGEYVWEVSPWEASNAV